MSETYSKPLPKPRPIDEPYWEGMAAGELRLQQCTNCARWRFPPAELCPNCLSGEYEWKAALGTATLWSWIVMHREYFASFHDDIPYNVAFVRLDEGPFMMSNVVGVAPEELTVDARLQVTFDAVTDEFTIPRFRLL